MIPKRIPPFGDEDISNRVSMSSTVKGSGIFERTEVLAGRTLGRAAFWKIWLQPEAPKVLLPLGPDSRRGASLWCRFLGGGC